MVKAKDITRNLKIKRLRPLKNNRQRTTPIIGTADFLQELYDQWESKAVRLQDRNWKRIHWGS
jgi:hypothetical protein